MLITSFTLLEKWYIWSPLKWAWSKRNDKCYPTVYIRITAFRVDKIKASEFENLGVAESRFRCGPRVSGPTINKMPSYGLYSTNHFPS